jgi:hypothetical protein
MYIPIQGDGGSTPFDETCEPPSEPDSHCEEPCQSVRKLTSRFQLELIEQGAKLTR